MSDFPSEKIIILTKNCSPKYMTIEDIGSGINFNKKKLRKIIKLAVNGKIKRAVAYENIEILPMLEMTDFINN